MIGKIIELLHSNDFYNVSENVEIAKGKYEMVTNFSDAKEKIKKDMAVEKVIKIVVDTNGAKASTKGLGNEILEQKKITLEFQRELNLLEQRLRYTAKGALHEQQKLRTQISHVKDAIKDQNLSLKEMSIQQQSSNKGIANSTGLANTAVQELGRGLSDSAYGIQGVANNVSQLGSLFGMLVTKTGGFSMALKSMWASLMGPLGLLVAFQGLTAFIQTDFFKAMLAGGLAQKQYNEALREGAKNASENVSKLDTLVATAKDHTLSLHDRKAAINLINQDYPEYLGNITLENIDTDESTLAIRKNIEALNQQAFAKAIQAKKQAAYIKVIEAETSGISDNVSVLEMAWIRLKNLSLGGTVSTGSISDAVAKGVENRKKKVNEAKKEIESLDKLIKDKLSRDDIDVYDLFGQEKDSKKTKKEKEEVDNSEQDEIKRQKAIQKIRDEFYDKNKELEDESFFEKLDRQYDKDLMELEALEATEEQKYELKKYYAKLIADEQERIIKDFATEEEQSIRDLEDKRLQNAEEEIKREQLVADAKKDITNKTADLIIALAGKQSKIGKALAIANILREQIEGAVKAKANLVLANAKAVAASPLTAGQPFVGINTAQTLLGIAGSAVGAKQAISQINSGGSGSISGGGSSSTETSAPSFNLVQGTPQNQLAESLNNQSNRPIQTYVTTGAVTTGQSLDRNKINESSI